MSYSIIALVIRAELIGILGGLAVTVVIQILTGRINMRLLLYGRRADGTLYFSSERVQMLVATLAIALQYTLNATRTVTGQMPSLPDGALELLGLSQSVYLAGKAWMSLRR